jgi:hypothetical protein
MSYNAQVLVNKYEKDIEKFLEINPKVEADFRVTLEMWFDEYETIKEFLDKLLSEG